MLLGGPASCCQNGVLRPGLPLAGLLPMGLDRTGTPPTVGISSPTLQLMWLLPVLSFIVICLCNFCPFPGWWAPERQGLYLLSALSPGVRNSAGARGHAARLCWLGGWVGGPSRAMTYTEQVQLHTGCYFSYLKRSLLSCLITSQLCLPRPTATPPVTCVRPSPPSPPQNPPRQLAAPPCPCVNSSEGAGGCGL